MTIQLFGGESCVSKLHKVASCALWQPCTSMQTIQAVLIAQLQKTTPFSLPCACIDNVNRCSGRSCLLMNVKQGLLNEKREFTSVSTRFLLL